MIKLRGTGVALVTPFNNDLSIDYEALEKLINYQIAGNINYIVLMGTTGESVVLSNNEKRDIVNFSKKIINNRVPIVLGVGGNNTLEIVNYLEKNDLSGISAILSVSPSYNKPSQEGIIKHYKIISKSSPVPVIIYNVPGRTASNISAETTLKLANEISNIIGIKEASGDFDQIMTIIKKKPNDFLVISGDDGLTVPMIYMGANGVISVIGQSLPKEFSEMVNKALIGEIKEANKIHYKLHSYYNAIYSEGNPVGIKAHLEHLGICNSFVRPPLVQASEKIKSMLNSIQ